MCVNTPVKLIIETKTKYQVKLFRTTKTAKETNIGSKKIVCVNTPVKPIVETKKQNKNETRKNNKGTTSTKKIESTSIKAISNAWKNKERENRHFLVVKTKRKRNNETKQTKRMLKWKDHKIDEMRD